MSRARISELPLWRDPLLVPYVFVVLAIALPGRLLLEPLGALGYPATIIAAAAPLVYLLGRLLPGYLADGFQPVRVALLVFGLVALIAYAVGLTKALSGAETTASLRAMINHAGYVGLGLIVLDGVRDRRHLDRLLTFVVLGGCLLAVFGIVQFVTGANPDTYITIPGLTLQAADITTQRSYFDRVQGTALHPIEFGVVLMVILPIALHYALHGVTGPPSRWRWVPVVLILVAAPMSVSRSSILGLLAGVGFVAVTWTWRMRLKALFAGLVLAVAMRAAFPGLLGTLRGMFTFAGEDPSVEGRTDDYPLIMEFFEKDPWLGRGLGTLIPTEHFFVDNEYLGTLVNSGLLGLISLIALFVVVISVGRGVYHHARDPGARSLGQALAGAALVSMVTWVTYDGLGFRVNAGHAFILFGAVGALWRLEVGGLRWGHGIRKGMPVTVHASDDDGDTAGGPADLAEPAPPALSGHS